MQQLSKVCKDFAILPERKEQEQYSKVSNSDKMSKLHG